MNRTDRFLGMLVGHAIGESLGAPYEFGRKMNHPYRGRVEYPFYITSRWKMTPKPGATLINDHLIAWPPGTLTDDSQMMLCILRSMIGKAKYDREATLDSYLEWASSTPVDMGFNTRELFRSTVKDKRAKYRREYEKKFGPESAGKTQILSNGALMRCAPLALFPDLEAFKEDCMLTNPYPISIECNVLYGLALWMALRDWSREDIYLKVREAATQTEVIEVFDQLDRGIPRNCSGKTKGYCCHAFYFAMRVLKTGTDYRTTVDAIAPLPDTDTDTNACIAGALAGALEGFTTMMNDPITRDNYAIIQRTNNLDYAIIMRHLGFPI
jgi:ADP-ribosylglycohydrolase